MSRYRPQRTRSGVVLSSSLDARPRPTQPMTGIGLHRAVVLSTFVTDSTSNLRRFQVECDVLLVSEQFTLRRVPVAQANHGVNNVHSLWVPRPSTRAISTNTPINLSAASLRGSAQGPVTGFDDFDGDMVIVEYVEGKLDYPLITKALTHERTKRLVVAGSGWAEGDTSMRGKPHADEFFVSHQGTEVRINKGGDVLIDTVGAHDDLVNESAATGAGQVRLRLKESQRFTVEMDGEDVLEVWKDGSGVHIDLGEGATDHIHRGEALDQWLLAHTHPDGFGGTSPPTDPTLTGEVLSQTLSTQHRVK